MTQYRGLFEVKADLALRQDLPEANIDLNGYRLRLRNGPVADDGHVHLLIAVLIGESASIKEAVDDLQAALAEHLDYLSFATQSRFEIVECKSVVDWTPGLKERQVLVMQRFDPRFPPNPELDYATVETAAAFIGAKLPQFLKTAFSAYRAGCIDKVQTDQFKSFFSVLELIAENIIEKAKVPISCQACKKNLVCSACSTEAMRTPFAKQAIEEIIEKITGHTKSTIAKNIFLFRNGLTHGRRTKSMEKEYGEPLEKYVNIVGQLAWRALLNAAGPYLGEGAALKFSSHDGKFVVGNVRASSLLVMTQASAGDVPTEDEIPTAQIKQIVTFDMNHAEKHPD